MIFVVAAVAFRSVLAGLLVLAPLAVVVTLVFGVMGYAGVPLNIPNSLISAMAVGIGADYAIYLIYRVREYVAQGLSLPEAVGSAVRTAGKACLFVATAVAGGYAVLLFSYDYKVHMWLSTFIIIAMLGAVLVNSANRPDPLIWRLPGVRSRFPVPPEAVVPAAMLTNSVVTPPAANRPRYTSKPPLFWLMYPGTNSAPGVTLAV